MDMQLYDWSVPATYYDTATLFSDHHGTGNLVVLFLYVLFVEQGVVVCLILACQPHLVTFINSLPSMIKARHPPKSGTIAVLHTFNFAVPDRR